MKKLLIDTSVLIDFLRVKSQKEETLYYKLAKAGHPFYASILTHSELFSGKSIWEDKNARSAAEKLFSEIELIPLDITVSQQAGKIRAYYDITLIDSIIAATALINKLRLVTLNKKDFKKIKGLKLLD